MSETFDRLRSRTDEMVGLLGDLVASESPSAEPDRLRATADLLAARGTELLGREPEWLDRGACPVLRWRVPGRGRPVLVIGHLDTVWPLGTIARWPFSVADGRATGPGALDMKAGLVQALFALAGLAGEHAEAVFLVTSDEEVGSPYGRRFVEEAAGEARAVLVPEASAAGKLKLARKGVGTYHLSITGRAAHAGLEPEKGVNALAVAANLVSRLDAVADVTAGTTVTPTLASAGTTANTVPAQAAVTIDVRAATVAEQRRVDDELRALPVPAGARLAVEGGINRPPMEPDASADLFALAASLAPGCGIDRLEGTSVGGGSDGNFTAALGVPTLDGVGAVGEGAHAEGEYVVVEEMARRAALVAELIAAVEESR